jgi:uncharacterized lipoprotein YehR (DUF1307 family)
MKKILLIICCLILITGCGKQKESLTMCTLNIGDNISYKDMIYHINDTVTRIVYERTKTFDTITEAIEEEENLKNECQEAPSFAKCKVERNGNTVTSYDQLTYEKDDEESYIDTLKEYEEHESLDYKCVEN